MKSIGFMWIVLGLVCGPALAVPGYDIYKLSQDGTPIPDVNKAGGLEDNSCWQAAAANLLAGAGWGKAGQSAAQNAAAIYGHMTAHFGTACGGYEERAINWWLANYGKNPNAPDTSYYDPNNSYTDVTHVLRTLSAGDYEFLLNELVRCQYVAVSFLKPREELGHVMTLVGGNRTPWAVPPGLGQQVAVWHDSDRNLNPPPPSDDVLTNRWQGANINATWYLDYWQTPDVPDDDWLAENYTTLCPGLKKPKQAMENYDLAYFKDMDAAGKWFNTFREAGAKKDVYADPVWDDEHLRLTIGNEEIQNFTKDIWLLVDYLDRDNNVPPGITLDTPLEQGLTPEIDYSPDYGQILLHWSLTYQPAWETFVFPTADYWALSGDVKDFDIATICIPEPTTVALLALGLIGLRRRR